MTQYFILLVLLIMTSCKGPSKTAENNISFAEKAELSDAQIAEYVVEVFEDSRGHLWFGTMSKGVARYDGKNLKYFSEQDGLTAQTVSSIIEDKGGTMYFGCHTGLFSYDPTAEKKGLKPFAQRIETSGRHDEGTGWIGVSIDQSQNIWISNNDGLYNYKNKQLVEYKLPIDRDSIKEYSITAGRARFQMEDSKGNLWFSTDGYGALKFDGEKFSRLTKADGLWSNSVNSILEDQEGMIWFACMQAYQPSTTNDGGVCRYNPSSTDLASAFQKFPKVEGLSNKDIYTLFMDNSGDIWIGATGTGAYIYDREKFTLYSGSDREDLTKYYGLQDILHDSKGNIWFGMSGGLFLFDPNIKTNRGSFLKHITQEGLLKF